MFGVLKNAVSVMLLGVSVSACVSDVTDVWTPEILSDSFENKGWVMLFPPDSKYKPGTLIRVDAESGPRFVGYLSSCNIDDDALKIIPGKSPAINFKRTDGFSINVLLGLKGVTGIGPEASKVKSVELKISDSGADAIDMIKFTGALTDPANAASVPQVCRNYLDAPDHYIVNEAFRISGGTYSLKDESGVKLKVTNAVLSSILTLGGEAGYKVTSEGDIAITSPVYIAVRRAMKAGDIWTTLGPDDANASVADGLLRAYNQKMKLFKTY